MLFTAAGVPFTPSHAVNHGLRYRYYIERSLLRPETAKEDKAGRQVDGSESFQAKGWRLPAHQIEQLVSKQMAAFLRGRGAVLDELRCKRKSPDRVSALLGRASRLAEGCDAASFAEQSEIITALVRRVTVAQDKVTIEIDRKALAELLLDQETLSASEAKDHRAIMIEVPVTFRRRGVEAKLVVLDQRQPAGPDANLIKALARAHEWFARIHRGEANGVGDIARTERLDRSYVTRLLCLAFLAPEITKAILEGRQPTELTAKRLISSALNHPLLWPDQVDTIRC